MGKAKKRIGGKVASVGTALLLTGGALVSPAFAQDTADSGANQTEAESNTTVTGLRSTYAEAFLVVLNWNAVPGADSYELYRDGSVAFTSELDRTDTWSRAIFLDGETTYTFQVAAVIDGVRQPLSDPITVTTPVAGFRKHVLWLDSRWSAAIGNNLAVVSLREPRGVQTTYLWFRDGTLIEGANGPTLYDRGVTQGTTHSYQVREIRSDGELGPLSDPLGVTIPGTPPGVPLPAPDIRSTFVDQSTAVFFVGQASGSEGRPAANGAQRHEIWRNGDLIDSEGNGWFVDRDLDRNTTYSYRFRAVAVDGTLGEWTDFEITTLAVGPNII